MGKKSHEMSHENKRRGQMKPLQNQKLNNTRRPLNRMKKKNRWRKGLFEKKKKVRIFDVQRDQPQSQKKTLKITKDQTAATSKEKSALKENPIMEHLLKTVRQPYVKLYDVQAMINKVSRSIEKATQKTNEKVQGPKKQIRISSSALIKSTLSIDENSDLCLAECFNDATEKANSRPESPNRQTRISSSACIISTLSINEKNDSCSLKHFNETTKKASSRPRSPAEKTRIPLLNHIDNKTSQKVDKNSTSRPVKRTKITSLVRIDNNFNSDDNSDTSSSSQIIHKIAKSFEEEKSQAPEFPSVKPLSGRNKIKLKLTYHKRKYIISSDEEESSNSTEQTTVKKKRRRLVKKPKSVAMISSSDSSSESQFSDNKPAESNSPVKNSPELELLNNKSSESLFSENNSSEVPNPEQNSSASSEKNSPEPLLPEENNPKLIFSESSSSDSSISDSDSAGSSISVGTFPKTIIFFDGRPESSLSEMELPELRVRLTRLEDMKKNVYIENWNNKALDATIQQFELEMSAEENRTSEIEDDNVSNSSFDSDRTEIIQRDLPVVNLISRYFTDTTECLTLSEEMKTEDEELPTPDESMIENYMPSKELKVFLIKLDSICSIDSQYSASEIELISKRYMDIIMNSNFSFEIPKYESIETNEHESVCNQELDERLEAQGDPLDSTVIMDNTDLSDRNTSENSNNSDNNTCRIAENLTQDLRDLEIPGTPEKSLINSAPSPPKNDDSSTSTFNNLAAASSENQSKPSSPDAAKKQSSKSPPRKESANDECVAICDRELEQPEVDQNCQESPTRDDERPENAVATSSSSSQEVQIENLPSVSSSIMDKSKACTKKNIISEKFGVLSTKKNSRLSEKRLRLIKAKMDGKSLDQNEGDTEQESKLSYKCIICHQDFKHYGTLQQHFNTHALKSSKTPDHPTSKTSDPVSINTDDAAPKAGTSNSTNNNGNLRAFRMKRANQKSYTEFFTDIHSISPTDKNKRPTSNKEKKSKLKHRIQSTNNSTTCSICTQDFTTKEDLASHIYGHTSTELQQAYAKLSEGKQSEKLAPEVSSLEAEEQPSDSNKESKENEEDEGPRARARIASTDPQKKKTAVEESRAEARTEEPNPGTASKVKICECHRDSLADASTMSVEIGLICNICEVLFRSMECYETHCRATDCQTKQHSSSRSPKLFCTDCCMVSSSIQIVRQHLEIHARVDASRPMDFRCNICKVKFIGIGKLFYTHWSNHASNPFFVASQQSFPKNSVISSRKDEVFIRVAEYMCLNCRSAYSSENELKKHSSTCNGSSSGGSNVENQEGSAVRLIRDASNDVFDDRATLFQREKTKHGCRIDPQYVQVRMDSRQDGFQCRVCKHCYSDYRAFEEHWRTHDKMDTLEHARKEDENEKDGMPGCEVNYLKNKFVCKFCDVGFESQVALQVHMDSVHEKRPRSNCLDRESRVVETSSEVDSVQSKLEEANRSALRQKDDVESLIRILEGREEESDADSPTDIVVEGLKRSLNDLAGQETSKNSKTVSQKVASASSTVERNVASGNEKSRNVEISSVPLRSKDFSNVARDTRVESDLLIAESSELQTKPSEALRATSSDLEKSKTFVAVKEAESRVVPLENTKSKTLEDTTKSKVVGEQSRGNSIGSSSSVVLSMNNSNAVGLIPNTVPNVTTVPSYKPLSNDSSKKLGEPSTSNIPASSTGPVEGPSGSSSMKPRQEASSAVPILNGSQIETSKSTSEPRIGFLRVKTLEELREKKNTHSCYVCKLTFSAIQDLEKHLPVHKTAKNTKELIRIPPGAPKNNYNAQQRKDIAAKKINTTKSSITSTAPPYSAPNFSYYPPSTSGKTTLSHPFATRAPGASNIRASERPNTQAQIWDLSEINRINAASKTAFHKNLPACDISRTSIAQARPPIKKTSTNTMENQNSTNVSSSNVSSIENPARNTPDTSSMCTNLSKNAQESDQHRGNRQQFSQIVQSATNQVTNQPDQPVHPLTFYCQYPYILSNPSTVQNQQQVYQSVDNSDKRVVYIQDPYTNTAQRVIHPSDSGNTLHLVANEYQVSIGAHGVKNPEKF